MMKGHDMSENCPEKDIVFAPMKLLPEVVEARREQLENKVNMSLSDTVKEIRRERKKRKFPGLYREKD